MIPEYDVLCSMFDFPVNKELVDHAPNLKMVANYAVGYNNSTYFTTAYKKFYGVTPSRFRDYHAVSGMTEAREETPAGGNDRL